MSDGGKGSGRRPGSGYQDNWERIFGGKTSAPDCTALPHSPTASVTQSEAPFAGGKPPLEAGHCSPLPACTEVHSTSSVQSSAQSGAGAGATPNWGAPHSLCIEYELSAVQISGAPDCREKCDE